MTHGGVVFRAGDRLMFLPATIALKVMPAPPIARVPGGPPELRGVALVDGDMIAIVAPDTQTTGGAMLVCTVMGEQVGLVGVDVVATGRFPAEGGDVRHGAEIARAFDLASLIAKVHDTSWGATLSE